MQAWSAHLLALVEVERSPEPDRKAIARSRLRVEA
jgi:hypothetical protein